MCSTPNPGSGGGGDHRHGPEAMASFTNTTATTSASSPPGTDHHHQQHQPGRRGTRGSGGGSATSAGGLTSAGSGTSATVFNSLADPAEDHQCSLRGLVWKVLLGTIHTDSVLYIRLVAKGPSSEDAKIKEDTFRTFPRDEEFRRRVHEHKLSRINNAYVRLNRPEGCSTAEAAAAATAAERRGSGDRERESRGRRESGSSNDDDTGNGNGGGDEQQLESDDFFGGSSSAAVDEPGAEAGLGGDGVASGSGSGGAAAGVAKGEERVGDRGKGVYVQGMMVLCAPLLFVMPEVDAFFCFNSLLNQHMPR